MLKSILAVAAVTFALATPVLASDMAKADMPTCDDATMKMMNDAIKADTDPKMKDGVDMANKAMAMAGDSMKAGKMDDCSMHMGEAKKAMMMK